MLYQPGNASFWANEAFQYYLPHDPQTLDLLLRAAKERGLTPNLERILADRGVRKDQVKVLD